MKFNAIGTEYIVCWDRKKALLVAFKIFIMAVFKKKAFYRFDSKECAINIMYPNKSLDSDGKKPPQVS